MSKSFLAHRRPLLASLTVAAIASAVVGAASPASAGTSGDTDTTFELTGGSLAISAPASANLGEKATGVGTLSAALGEVSVTDGRGQLAATWTTSAVATDFTTGAGTAAETISASQVSYAPGLATTSTPGTGVFAGTPLASMALNAPVFTGAAAGNNSATWSPTITVVVPSQAVAGTYRGTITHSVS